MPAEQTAEVAGHALRTGYRSSFQAFDSELTVAEMRRLPELDRSERTGPNRDTFA